MLNNDNYIHLNVADGTTMAAYIALPEDTGTPAPGLILLQEAYGVNHHIRSVAERFAARGFAVIAPELFHRDAPEHFEGAYGDFAKVMPYMQALTTEGLTADLLAAYHWIATNAQVNHERIYSIGYCMGGRVSFLANVVLPLKAAVSYYGGGTQSLAHLAGELHGPHLFFWGGQDDHIKPEHIKTVTDALDAAGKDYVNVVISYAGHAFNSDERPSYNKKAADEALALALAFLADN